MTALLYAASIPLDLRYHVTRAAEKPWENRRVMRFLSLYTGRAYTVEIGFFFDLASVPRLPIVYMFFGGRAIPASLWHDYIYENGIGTKEEADAVFAEIMDLCGEPAWRRFWMFKGVQFGGRGNFTDDTGALKSGFVISPGVVE